MILSIRPSEQRTKSGRRTVCVQIIGEATRGNLHEHCSTRSELRTLLDTFVDAAVDASDHVLDAEVH